MRGPPESKNCDRTVTGWPVRAYEAGLRGPVVDALRATPMRFIETDITKYVLHMRSERALAIQLYSPNVCSLFTREKGGRVSTCSVSLHSLDSSPGVEQAITRFC